MKTTHILGATWGIIGFTLIIGMAVIKLLPHALEALRMGLTTFEWIVLVGWSVFMLVSEGYRGFQKQFAPHFALRLRHLLEKPAMIDLILAPLYCMGYFHAPKKRIIITWSLTVSIILAVVIVRQFPQPWRGIIDCGVVLGLMYGLIWVYILALRSYKANK